MAATFQFPAPEGGSDGTRKEGTKGVQFSALFRVTTILPTPEVSSYFVPHRENFAAIYEYLSERKIWKLHLPPLPHTL